jgi:Family of unknown function (DUF6131)
MIIFGIILLITGIITGISLLTVLGVITLAIGLILFMLGTTGHAVGGRRHWF